MAKPIEDKKGTYVLNYPAGGFTNVILQDMTPNQIFSALKDKNLELKNAKMIITPPAVGSIGNSLITFELPDGSKN